MGQLIFSEVVRMRPIRPLLAFVYLMIGYCSLSWSQAFFSSLRGTITDPSGAVIPGATVTIVNKSTSLQSTQTANGSGEYQFQQVVPGTYVITAHDSGFRS